MTFKQKLVALSLVIFSSLVFGVGFKVILKLKHCTDRSQDLHATSDKQDYELKFYSTYLDMEWKDKEKEKRALFGQKQIINFNDQVFKRQALDYFEKCDYKFQRIVLLNVLKGYDMYLDLKFHYLKEAIENYWVEELKKDINFSLGVL